MIQTNFFESKLCFQVMIPVISNFKNQLLGPLIQDYWNIFYKNNLLLRNMAEGLYQNNKPDGFLFQSYSSV